MKAMRQRFNFSTNFSLLTIIKFGATYTLLKQTSTFDDGL